MNYIDLGNRVRNLRRRQKLTQQELADRIGIAASFLGHIERGTRIASIETLVALCEALDTDPNYLLAGSTSFISRHMPDSIPVEDRRQVSALLQHAFDVISTAHD